MLYGHTVSALLAPRYQTGPGSTSGVPARLTPASSCCSPALRSASRPAAIGARTVQFSPAVLNRCDCSRVRGAGYALHFPVQRFVQLPSATPEPWRSFLAVDVLQLIGVTISGVQLIVMVARSRTVFGWVAFALALTAILVTPLFWGVDWARRLPLWLAAYLAPSAGSQFPLLPWARTVLSARRWDSGILRLAPREARLVCECRALRARDGAGDAGRCDWRPAGVARRCRRLGRGSESGCAAHGRVAHAAGPYRSSQSANHAAPARL